jgi:hypothetical protein
MRGDLSDTTVPAICRSLASQDASGRLVLLGGADATGTITLLTGAIVDASSPLPRARLRERLTGAGHLDELTMARVVHELREASPEPNAGAASGDAVLARGLLDRQLVDPELVDRLLIAPVVDALVELFGRRRGEYRFEAKGAGEPVGTGSGVHLEVERALVEVTRRSDAVAALPSAARSPDTVPLLLLHLPATPADFDAEALTVIASIDDQSNLGEIARRMGYGFFDVARVTAGLYDRGVVALTHPQAGLTAQVAQTVGVSHGAAVPPTEASRAAPVRLPVDRSVDRSADDGQVGQGEHGRFEEAQVDRTSTAHSAPGPTWERRAPSDAAASPGAAGHGDPEASRDEATSSRPSASREPGGGGGTSGGPAGGGGTGGGPAGGGTGGGPAGGGTGGGPAGGGGTSDGPGALADATSGGPGGAARNGAAPRRSDDDDTDVSEFLRELSSLANRDDTRARRTVSPTQAARAGRREPHDGGPDGPGDDRVGRSGADDEAESPDEHRHQGSAPAPDGRKRRGFFGRG